MSEPALYERDWAPPASAAPRGAIMLVHGLGEHSGRYAHVATALAAAGFTVRAYDQRGFGRSPGPRGTIPGNDALLDDLKVEFERFSQVHEDPFLFGHSLGGLVVARAVTAGVVTPRAMVLSSPAFTPRMNAFDRVATRIGMRLAPNLRVPHPLRLDKLSHDPVNAVAIASDPLCHDRVTPRLAAFLRDAGEQAISDASRCHVPTLLLVSGDDMLVDPEGSRRFRESLPPGVGSMKVYPTLWHEILNELPADRDAIMATMIDWLAIT
ncbi:MAG: alpha/beta hydrolase fold protein [Gemmatimonadetes bacterium]|nr:alpha/beta hydrolase fold protein [Gemmatimonadota bacterium]